MSRWSGIRSSCASGSRATAVSSRRRDDVLAYFDHRASNGPTEAINGRLEALRRNALGFRRAPSSVQRRPK
jgi:transposase